MRTQRFATAQENEEYRLAPAPPDIVQPVSVAESFGMPSGRSRQRGGRARALEDDGGDQFRLSPVPEDEQPAVAVAQGYGGRARQLAVIEIASVIAGAAMTRILDNEGDVKWELDQLNGVAHPDNKTSSPSSAAYTSKRVAVPGFWVENLATDRITADFEITFQYNGASVGYIQVSNTGTNDAVGWGLTVKENIMADPNTYTTVPPDGSRFAAVKVRFHYRFDRSIGSDSIGIKEYTLYGNGAVKVESRWTQ
jgi:hypothetical protein